MIRAIIGKEDAIRLRKICNENWPDSFFFVRKLDEYKVELNFEGNNSQEEQQFQVLINK